MGSVLINHERGAKKQIMTRHLVSMTVLTSPAPRNAPASMSCVKSQITKRLTAGKILAAKSVKLLFGSKKLIKYLALIHMKISEGMAVAAVNKSTFLIDEFAPSAS